MTNPFEGKKAKFVKGHIELRSEKSERNYKKALERKHGMTPAQKALKRHQLLAAEEHEKNKDYEKKFGTFSERFDNYAKWKKSL